MNAQEFTYWLQGFAELHQDPPTPEQWKSIREHLALVFKKVTPPVQVEKPVDIRKAIDDMRQSYPFMPEPTRTWLIERDPPGVDLRPRCSSDRTCC